MYRENPYTITQKNELQQKHGQYNSRSMNVCG